MKNQFLSNILLTFIWVAITGNFTFLNFVFGFIISFFILRLVAPSERRKYFKILPKVISFIFYFLYELIKANLEVAYEVLTPNLNMTPGIIQFPLDAETDLEITFLANLITLTPGTLSLDVSDDKKVLYVHSMYIKDRESFVAGIKNGFEKRILEILR
ncbi:MAG TPA: Na+/H+ antiporter subunit E [Gillisia sp.]|nr:Na+/H+ antiporter subunit E [Gillisia sp.]